MYEIARMRHGVENMLISDLVAENESNVQITHKPFISKLLTKGIHWESKIEHAIQKNFGVLPERGRVVSNCSWSAISWGGNEYLMIATDTRSFLRSLDDQKQSEEDGIVMIDVSSAYECFSISGTAVIDLIKTCCFLDVDDPSFSNNSVATCRLGPFCVVLQKNSQALLFDFYIERSLAIPFVRYLVANGYPFKVSYLKS
jgi:sarcosine oxidase gamma subunit|tara:strand:+ start:5199 stop:5798 length:600 start_codon:yes stop_codon:yes gene_type:complete